MAEIDRRPRFDEGELLRHHFADLRQAGFPPWTWSGQQF
jgi:hypothetical protein